MKFELPSCSVRKCRTHDPVFRADCFTSKHPLDDSTQVHTLEIAALQLSPLALIFLLLIFYVVLGCVLDGLSAIVMTLPITLPLVLAAGFDKIWFGIFVVIVVELAQITPPVGFNLFVIQGLTGESIGRVARATIPFFIIMCAFAFLIAVFPEIVTFLPDSIKLRG